MLLMQNETGCQGVFFSPFPFQNVIISMKTSKCREERKGGRRRATKKKKMRQLARVHEDEKCMHAFMIAHLAGPKDEVPQ